MSIIITDNIEKECINLLSLYKDKAQIQKVLLRNYPGLSEKKQGTVPVKVRSLISQGMDLLEETDRNIKTAPLTLFYSIYNFAKAIFYMNFPNESIANSHGLSFLEEQYYSGADEVGKVAVKINSKGAFSNLIKVTGDLFKTDELISAKTIFSTLPELNNVYALRYLEEPEVLLLRQNNFSQRSYEIMYQMGDAVELSRFDFLCSKGLLVTTSGNYTNVAKSEDCTDAMFEECTYSDVYGNVYLACGIDTQSGKQKISKIALLYLIYYMFSMLVRYYPEKWMAFCDGADSSVISKLVISMRREMIVEVLKLLSGENYTFATKLESVEKEMSDDELLERIKKALVKERIRSGKDPFDLLK